MKKDNPFRQARKAKGLSVKALCEATGCTLAQISQYELGLRKPYPDTLAKINKVLGSAITIVAEWRNHVGKERIKRWEEAASESDSSGSLAKHEQATSE